MPITLGLQPNDLTVVLARGGDFVAELVADEPWPAGTTITLELFRGTSSTTWPATVDGTRATWAVPATQVEEVIEAGLRAARLHYVDESGAALIWGRGRTHVID